MAAPNNHSPRWRRAMRGGVIALAIVLAVPVAASAHDWQTGDVFVGLSDGQYNVYDNAGTLREVLDQTATAGHRAVDCAFDNSGVLHTTAFDDAKLVRFLLPHAHSKLADVTVGTQPESVSFARDGSYYVGHQANPNSLRRFSGAGTPLANFTPAAPASLIDLSADQRTLFFTDRSGAAAPVIHRFDVATGTDLPDFANVGGGTRTLADLKLLPPGDGSGGLIVAQTTDIKRLDGAGNVLQTYDVSGQDTWFGIALDPDGKSFWAQTSTPGAVFRFNIASGAVDRGPLPSAATAFGICVRGTRLAALDNAPPSIAITTPADGATFAQGQRVTASFACSDDQFGTGIASCNGTVANGAPIDTASVGTKTFKVDAADVAGNTTSLTRSYTVVPVGPPPPRIVVSVSFRFAASNTQTRFTSLSVKGIPRGSTLTVSCKPKSKRSKCPAKKFTKKNARGTVKLKTFIGKKLKKGTVITIQVTKPGMIGAVKLLTIRKRNGPSTATRCLPPAAKRPTKCS